MPLPILKVSSAPTTETLVRYFHQATSSWTANVAELSPLDFGSAWSNPQLKELPLANRMLDVALPPEITPPQAVQLAEEHFASQGSMCLEWVTNPSAPAQQTGPIIEHLKILNYQPAVIDILYLGHLSAINAEVKMNLTVIPTRASFKHARSLYEESTKNEQHVEAEMLQLDDPHFDALIALKDGKAIAHVGVLSLGEIGLVRHLFVSESERKQGIGKLMMNRAMEICARSLFKHVLIGADPGNSIAISLFKKFGFQKIGEFVSYRKSGT